MAQNSFDPRRAAPYRWAASSLRNFQAPFISDEPDVQPGGFGREGEREQEFKHFAVWLHRPSKPSGLSADVLRSGTSLQNSLRTNRESSWWATCRGGHFRADSLLMWLFCGACSHEQDAVKPVGWLLAPKFAASVAHWSPWPGLSAWVLCELMLTLCRASVRSECIFGLLFSTSWQSPSGENRQATGRRVDRSQ